MAPLLAHRARADRQFERLYRRHVGDVYRYALAVLRNPADAEDVTQTTFLNAYRAYAGGARAERPQNWLIAIAHNVCRQRFRQAARRPSEVELNEELAGAAVPEEHVGVEDIQRALGHLAFNQRAALVMRELEGLSYTEISAALDVSVAAVETLIFRARRSLREQLEGSLTCGEAERAISRQLDGALRRDERAQLRGHLRECASCSSIARRLRAQRGAWKALGAIPLPGTLTGLFGGGGATTTTGAGILGGGVAAKAAAVVATAAVASGTVYEGKKLAVDPAHANAAPAASSAATTTAHRGSSHARTTGRPERRFVPAAPEAQPAASVATAPDRVTGAGPPGGPKPAKAQSAVAVGGGSAEAPGQAARPAGEPGTAPKASTKSFTKKPKPAQGRGRGPEKVKQKPRAARSAPATAAAHPAEPGKGDGSGKGATEPNEHGKAGGNGTGRGEPGAAVATEPAATTVPTGSGSSNADGNGNGDVAAKGNGNAVGGAKK